MNKEYFIVVNGEQAGPYTFEQLKGMNLTAESKIWYQGLDTWKMLSEVPEYQQLQEPPPVINTGNSNWQPPEGSAAFVKPPLPKSYLTESILATLFCCWPLGIPAIVNAAKVESKYNAGDYQGAEDASAQAKKYMQYSFFSGLVIGVLYLLLVIATGGRNL